MNTEQEQQSSTRAGFAISVGVLCMVTAGVPGQAPGDAYNAIRQWGTTYVDSDARLLPAIDIEFDQQLGALVRADGRIFVQGQEASWLCRPPEGVFTDVEIGGRFALGLRADGTIAVWGEKAYIVSPIPNLPAGVTYVGMAAGYYHTILLRSDGQVEATGFNWDGQLNIPALPPGVTFVKVKAAEYHTVGLLSDGSVAAWGLNDYGQTDVPPLPPGMTYTDVSCGYAHCLALRSDGMIVGWGMNISGQLDVPPLPTGTQYELCAAGWDCSIAWRSDGVLVGWGVLAGWGTSTYSAADVPAVEAGVSCVQIEAASSVIARLSDGRVIGWGGDAYNSYGCPDPNPGVAQSPADVRFRDASVGVYHTLVLRGDGSVEGFGDTLYDALEAPSLPSHLRYVKVGAGYWNSMALRSDGHLLAWGWDYQGKSTVPPLPSGVTYVDFDMSSSHSVALRSDGNVMAFGLNNAGQCTVPTLPAGMSYLEVDAHYLHTVYRRSDGAILHAGAPDSWTSFIPSGPPPGLEYVDISTGLSHAAGILSDGTAEVWYHNVPAPTLPWGVYYVQVDCGDNYGWLRRSDGEVVMLLPPGLSHPWHATPELEPGTSYLSINAGVKTVIARVGPTCHYVGLHPGCAGSRPATRLVPRDTPRIGSTFEVRLFDLANDVALIGMGFQQIAPVDLAGIGMPGCELAIFVEGVQGLVGQGSQATWTLPIPDVAALVGVRFYNQALVLDVNAGNPSNLVISDMMEGVVGYP